MAQGNHLLEPTRSNPKFSACARTLRGSSRVALAELMRKAEEEKAGSRLPRWRFLTLAALTSRASFWESAAKEHRAGARLYLELCGNNK